MKWTYRSTIALDVTGNHYLPGSWSAVLEHRRRCLCCPRGRARSMKFSHPEKVESGRDYSRHPSTLHSGQPQLLRPSDLHPSSPAGLRSLSWHPPVHSLDGHLLARLLRKGVEEARLLICRCVSGLRGEGVRHGPIDYLGDLSPTMILLRTREITENELGDKCECARTAGKAKETLRA